MAIIQQIQQKTGCLFLIILGSLLLFVISDLIKSDQGFFGDNSLSVGEIKGEKVSYEEFNARYNEMLNQVMESNPGIDLDESMKSQYADQAWNSFLQDKIFADEYKKLGIQVSGDELADMTIGEHPDEQVVKAFQGQNGQFDKNRLIKFLQEDIEADEKTAARWLQFEEGLTQNTLGKKYAAVVRGSAYTTKLEAKQLWQNNNYAASGSFVGIQYATIPDQEIKVTDSDLKKELNDNKLKYKQDATRDIEFVSFSILPTSEDSAVTKNWAYDNVEKFKAYKYDSVFVNINGSEDPWDGTYKRIGSFDKSIENQLFALDSGGMIGPVYADGKYSIYKIAGIKQDSISVFKASHILVQLTTGTREDTLNSQIRVNSILNDLKAGKVKFEDAAVPNADGSGGNQGDLGWVTPTSQGISKKFYTLASSAPEGQIFVVTDEFGIHIAKVTTPKYNKLIKVAVLSQTVTSGSNTIKSASQKANDFYAAARSNKDFGKAAEGLKLSKRVAYDIRESDITIPGITEPKQIVRWLYNEESKVGSVSEILSFQTNYVVAKCTKIKKEGTSEIEDIRPALELVVRNKKKADRLEERFTKARAKSKTMAELASNVGSVEILIPQQIFSNDNIPGVGYDLKVLGTMFGCGTNKFSPIIRGENAVYVVWVSNINKPQAPATFDEFQKMSADQFKQGVDAGVMDALRKKAAIKDMRYKYF